MLTLEEFLQQYRDTVIEIQTCKDRLLELEYPQRGNRISSGEHAGISNQPEEYAIIKDQLERKVHALESILPHRKKQVEQLLARVQPRQARLLRKKYIDGLNTMELAAWMHVQPKTAIAAVNLAIEKAKPIYDVILASHKNKNAV